MKKYYFSLSSKSENTAKEVIIKEKNTGSFSRTSPIFLVNDDNIVPDNLDDGALLLLYTLDAYYSIARLKRAIIGFERAPLLFLTHGLCSILVYFPDKNDVISFLNQINKENYFANAIGYEVWHIEESRINYIKDQSKVSEFKVENALTLNTSDFKYEDVFIFNEIKSSFDYFYSFIKSYIPQYMDFAEELKRTIQELYYNTSFLIGVINEEEYKASLKLVFNDLQYVDKIFRNYSNIKSTQKTNTCHFQLKDELLQISAILRTINNQALFGMKCFDNLYSRSGYYAVFGTGLAYSAIFSMYTHVREIFSRNVNYSQVQAFFDQNSIESTCGIFQKDVDYATWKSNFDNSIKGIDHCLGNKERHIFYHLVYFSSRLGFRETKRSISFAKQVITLSIIPAWSLNVFTHEFMHAHVRGLMAILYPYSYPNTESLPQDIYENYTYYTDSAKTNSKLLSISKYIKISLMRAVHNLYCVNHHSSGDTVTGMPALEKEAIVRQLKNSQHYVDEILVDLLDFHYFYDSKPELYVTSIWSSWLCLPITLPRLYEYIMRTLVVVGSHSNQQSRTERFTYAFNLIKSQIAKLKKYEFVDDKQVDSVINKLKEPNLKNHLRGEYFHVWVMLSDILVKTLYSKTIRNIINTDEELSFDVEGSNSYNFSIGEFSERRINNPIGVLKSILAEKLDDTSKHNNEDIEGQSLWLLSLLSSKLFNE